MSTARRRTTRIRFAAAVLLMCAGAVQGQQPSKTLTMQASWPASSTFMDNFNQFADRVNKTTGGRLQIKTSAAGTIVPAFEVTDAELAAADRYEAPAAYVRTQVRLESGREAWLYVHVSSAGRAPEGEKHSS